jgi:PST family polysaccharide transporter
VTLKTQVAQGLKWQAINIVGRQLISLVVFTTLARLLEPSSFGLVGLIGVYLGFIAMFADQGIGPALIQRKDLEHEHKDTAFWTTVGCSLFLCCGTIVFARGISTLLGEPRLAPLLCWSSLGLVIRGLSAIHSTLLIKGMDFRRTTVRALASNLIGGVVGIFIALRGHGVWALIGQQLASALTGAFFLWIVSDYRPAFRFSVRHFRDLTSVGWSTFATSLLWFFSSRLDQMVIGRFIGVPTLGLYVIGNKLPDMAKTITQGPLSGISLPALSKLQDNHKRMCETIYRGMELNATVSFAIFIGLATISSDLVAILFGQKWAQAAPLSSLLSIYALVNVLLVFVHPALLASGGAGRYVILNVWQTAGMALACLVGIRFGVEYLILSVITVNLIIAMPALLFLKKRIGLNPLDYCRPCIMPCLAAVTMAFVIWTMSKIFPANAGSVFSVSCKVAIGALTYISFLLLFKRISLIRISDTVRHAFNQPRGAQID